MIQIMEWRRHYWVEDAGRSPWLFSHGKAGSIVFCTVITWTDRFSFFNPVL